MILVDTSVWIDHLRHSDIMLGDLLNRSKVISHPFVVGELAMGNLQDRDTLLSGFVDLPQALTADHEEVLAFIAQRTLFGLGIGYIDAHLLASVQMDLGTSLWTRDKRLLQAAIGLGLPVQREAYVN